MRIRRSAPAHLLAVLVAGVVAAGVVLAGPAFAADDTTPPSISAPWASAKTATTLTATWGAGSDDVGIISYRIHLHPGTSGQQAQVAEIPASTLSHTFTGLVPGAGYGLGLSAVDAAGNWSLSMATPNLIILPSLDTSAPTAPGTPVASAITATGFTLTWPASTDDVGVTGYTLSAMAYDMVFAGGSSTNAFTYTGLPANYTFTVSVAARDAAGNTSPRSPSITVRTTPSDTSPPTAPGTPVVSDLTSTGATVTWAPATDNVGVSRYEVWLGYTDVIYLAATVSGAVTTASLTGLQANTPYLVFVRAYDAAGNQASSPSRSFTTPPPGGVGCVATYRQVTSWPGNFQGEITVRNSGSIATRGWTVRWSWPASTTISQLWNGTVNSGSPQVSVSNVAWNGSLAPNATAVFGFNAAGPHVPPLLTCSAT